VSAVLLGHLREELAEVRVQLEELRPAVELGAGLLHAACGLERLADGRRRALEAAETDLLNRRIVTIPVKDWARFEAWASAPAREVPALRKLSKTRPVWQK
jgi:hypothetical protein